MQEMPFEISKCFQNMSRTHAFIVQSPPPSQFSDHGAATGYKWNRFAIATVYTISSYNIK